MAADQLEALEGERGPRAVADEAFESRAIVGLDADRGVEAEPSAVIPAEHVFGVMGLQEAVAGKVTEDPLSDRVLEPFEELRGVIGGLVEAEATGWFTALVSGLRIRIGLDPLEEAVHHTEVEMVVGIQRGAEPVQEARDPIRGGGRSRGPCFPQGGLQRPEQDVEDGGGGLGPMVEVGPEALGH